MQLANAVAHHLRADDEVLADPGDYYDEVIEIDLDHARRPYINGPTHPRPGPTAVKAPGRRGRAAKGWPMEVSAALDRKRAPTRATRTSAGPRRSPATPSAKGLTAKSTDSSITPWLRSQVRAHDRARRACSRHLEALGGDRAGQRLRAVHRPVGAR